MRCPNCGKEIANDSKFCEYCGATINLASSPEVSNEKNKSKKGLITFLIILLVCSFACIVWMTCREIAYTDYIGSYVWSYDLGVNWMSSNKRDGSSSFQEYTLFLDREDGIDIDYSVSSEENCDKLIITLTYPNGDQEVLLEDSGQKDSWVARSVWTSGMYKLKFQYQKDHSVSKYSDRASIERVVIQRHQIQNLYWFSKNFFRL